MTLCHIPAPALAWMLCAAVAVPLGAAEPLEPIKARYAETVIQAEDTYVEQLSELARQLTSRQKLEAAARLNRHIGPFRLGLEDPGTLQKNGKDISSGEIEEVTQTYTATVEPIREKLLDRYREEIEAATQRQDLQTALTVKKEMSAFEKGEYEPSVLDTPGRSPVFAGRYSGGKGRLVVPLNDKSIPDELGVAFRRRHARISGKGRHDTARIRGKKCGHFGKAVLFRRTGRRYWNGEGYLRPGSGKNDRGKYGAVLMQSDGGVKQITGFRDVPAGRVYRWSAVIRKNACRLKLSRDGEMVLQETVPAPPGTVFGFYAVVRRPGQQAQLLVSFE